MTQITLKMNPRDEASVTFFRYIRERDREMYPTIFSYLNAAVEMLEVSADNGRDFPILTEVDLQQIGLTVLDTLRVYELKKKEAQMVP